MIQFICLFFPGVLCVQLFEHLAKVQLGRKAWLCRYTLDVLLINLFCFAVKHFFLGTSMYALADPSGDMLPSVAMNYCILAIPMAVVLAVVQVFTKKHAALTVEGEPDEN